jgi:hypothetical protein
MHRLTAVGVDGLDDALQALLAARGEHDADTGLRRTSRRRFAPPCKME